MVGVEAEVLEAVVGGGVARAELLVGAGPGDVDRQAAVLAHAADEAVAEHPGLVADDLEGKRLLVPFGRAAGIGCLQVDVIDAKGHRGLLSSNVERCRAARYHRRFGP
jgi:hypothetical protein